jgi:hypothetical protein
VRANIANLGGSEQFLQEKSDHSRDHVVHLRGNTHRAFKGEKPPFGESDG